MNARKLIIAGFSLVLGSAVSVLGQSGPIGMTVGRGKAHLFDAGSNTYLATVASPGGGYEGDCTISSDAKKAVFSTVIPRALHVVDMTNPLAPVITGSIPISIYSADTSLTVDDKFALVTDGYGSTATAIVSLASQTQIGAFSPGTDSVAVDVLSDSSVLVASDNGSVVRRLLIDGSGNITNTGTTLGVRTPVNVYGAPGNKTGVVLTFSQSCSSSNCYPAVPPGQMISFTLPSLTKVVTRDLPGNSVSAAFSPSGDKIYIRTLLINSPTPTDPTPAVYDSRLVAYTFDPVTGAIGASPLYNVQVATTYAIYGGEYIAITPDGSRLYVSEGTALKFYSAATGVFLGSITNPAFSTLDGVCFAPHRPMLTITAPAAGSLYGVNSTVVTTGMFTEVGADGSHIATHTCQIKWDDGTQTAGNVSETGGSGNCSASHTFTEAGVYSIEMTVVDDYGSPDNKTVMIVVYDPTAGYVSGGGWINSPPGAFPADPSLTGHAEFGFVSRYARGATTPTGRTEFHFNAGDFHFQSDSYDWLVVAGAKAQFKGIGSVKGLGGYKFLLTATDGDRPGGGGVDKFRIKIIGPDGGLVYDNVAGASDDLDGANPQQIGGGNIMIHD